jgi:hypothetical protein
MTVLNWHMQQSWLAADFLHPKFRIMYVCFLFFVLKSDSVDVYFGYGDCFEGGIYPGINQACVTTTCLTLGQVLPKEKQTGSVSDVPDIRHCLLVYG